MSAQYGRDHCKIVVAKVLQTIGWHSISSTPLEVLTDILTKYIQQISKYANDYANQFGQTEVNLDHLGLAFQEMGINVKELEEYVSCINFIPGPAPAPKFPVPKENNLNFLKPGSKEVVTRPVHIHEHLPPMYPLLEGSDQEEQPAIKEEITVEETNLLNPQTFKKPPDLNELQKIKKEDEVSAGTSSRPTREISSVMMTTSGFLSPAREGKLPEAKAPVLPPVQETPSPLVLPPSEHVKKKVEKRKEKVNKEQIKAIPEEKPVKKLPTPKDFVKMKQKVAIANAVSAAQAVSASGAVTLTPIPMPVPQIVPPPVEVKMNPNSLPVQKFGIMKDKMDKALAAAKAKTEKLNTTITPIPFRSPIPIIFPQVEKLHNEPDRKKVNIIKKISNVKESKKKEPKGNHPLIIVDEATNIVNKITHLSSDITIEPINPNPIQMCKNPQIDTSFFDDAYGSPPTTPLTPRTPEIIMHSPPIIQNKRRNREPGTKAKRVKKDQFIDTSNLMNLSLLMERPKTPDAALLHHFKKLEVERKQRQAERKRQSHSPLIPPMGHPQLPFPFLANFGGPGLIPPQLSTPMFPFSQFGALPNFGKNYFSPVNPISVPPVMEPVPLPSPKVNDAVEIKPVEVVPPVQKSPQPPIQVPEASSSTNPSSVSPIPEDLKKQKEHKKEKKDKIKKKNKKDKEKKEKSEKKKLKEMKKDGKEKIKKEKKIKKKEKVEKPEVPPLPLENPIPKILLKVNSPSSRPETPESTKKLNIKPIVRKEEMIDTEEKKRELSPGGLAKISALVTGPPKVKSTLSPVIPPVLPEKPISEEPPPPVAPPKTPGRPRLHQQKPKASPKPKKVEQPFKKIDEQGNEVWICPACGLQDDGRPMIGCDGCDAWYHWVCVGIQVPPDENENWYCKPCLCRKNEDLQTDKKRKRKRKEKKDH